MPGIYSLSPYTPEEIVARDYLLSQSPDVILNIVDGTNLERNLYLTTQLAEMGIPMAIAVNMMDVVKKRGDSINCKALSLKMGIPAFEISAVKGDGIREVMAAAKKVAGGTPPKIDGLFSGDLAATLSEIGKKIASLPDVTGQNRRWYAVKLFGRDEKVLSRLNLPDALAKEIEQQIAVVEEKSADDSESIITAARYDYIASAFSGISKKKSRNQMTISDKIDRVVTNRFAALPIFVVIMALVYWIAMGPFGSFLTDWTNDTFVGAWIQSGLSEWLSGLHVASWLTGLVVDGIVGGVGALFGNSGLVAVSAYFIGVAAIILSGIILKKTKAFAGEPAPFVMELPAYHFPRTGNVVRATWERAWSFIKRAGTVILLSSVVLWFLQGFGFTDGKFGMVPDNHSSLLAAIGSGISWLFAPLGFGSWQAAVATFTGLIAKENVVSTFAVLYNYAGTISENGEEIWTALAASGDFTQLSAYSFMIFNLLCAPCFAAMGAIRREMNNARWTAAAIGYMCAFAYVSSLILYQLVGLIIGEVSFGAGTILAVAALVFLVYMLLRKGNRTKNEIRLRPSEASAE